LTGTRESNMARILVIEDNENNRVLLSRRLKSRGFEVLTAGDAESGLAMVAAERPNVVLMDIGLPGMDGLTATRLLKADPLTRHVPVIALTAHAMQGDEERSIQAGCDTYAVKPIDFPLLFSKIDALMPGNLETPTS
jgi:CheY-like chemotaxis protein